MSRTTFCDPPKGWEDRVKSLREDGLPVTQARALLQVELCLHLVEFLGRDDSETLGVVPYLLTGVPLYGVNWTKEQRHAIANARQIAPYASTAGWRAALELYIRIPDEWRHYKFPDEEIPGERNTEEQQETTEQEDDISPTPKTDWLICLLKRPEEERRHPQHTELYKRALADTLPTYKRKGKAAEAGATYKFTAAGKDGAKKSYTVTFPQKLPVVGNPTWLSTTPRSHEPITVHLRKDLYPIACFLDEADEKAKRKPNHWRKRLERIRYRRVMESGKLDDAHPDEITLHGFHHAAGMVASGKSTIAFLLAAWVIIARPDLRISIVVGDVQSSLRLADELNRYFCEDIEEDSPVAVPLLGRRTRDRHLRDLHGSREYQERRTAGDGHWGERFLSVVCPLQSLVPALADTPLPSGQEPCTNLRPLSEKPPKGTASDDVETPRTKRFFCPLYARCPIQQMYHDMAGARVWITTPWAMAYGSLPRQVESRPVHFGEVIYEQSDIVIVDEADAMMSVFDEVFAEIAELTNGKDGIYDRIGTQTEQFTIQRRSDAGGHRMRWSHAQRNGQDASMILLALLTNKETAYLRKWLERRQFTPHSLMARLVRMACGLVDFPRSGEADSDEDTGRFDEAFEPFRLLFGGVGDPLRQRSFTPDAKDATYRHAYHLWRLLMDIATGEGVFSDSILRSAKNWLRSTYPDIEKQIDLLNKRRREAQEKATPQRKNQKKEEQDNFEDLNRLAFRLIFALAAALLDRNTDIVLYEWHSRAAPDEDDVEPHRRMPAVLRDIIPLPPIGQQFGTYFAPGDNQVRNPNQLSYLSYTNIGRWYLLHFHELRTDLDGLPGPHVLALSGTSYLPDSVRLHLGTGNSKPQGVLLPEDTAMQAIGESVFRVLPLASPTQTPLRISGTPEWEKRAVLIQLAEALVNSEGGKLAAELADLKRLGVEQPNRWADRERLLLLVNSYEQAQIVGDALRQAWKNQVGRIYHLARTPKSGEGDELIGGASYKPTRGEDSTLQRTDIERFAHTGGRILVAPINAIGRGFNILNQQDPPLAAFGAVYFLVRPYPHPDDMTALARELNRRTLDWAEWEEFKPWSEFTIEGKYRALRHAGMAYWYDMERRKYWSTLHDRKECLCHPRKDLAAFTAGIIVQAVGRLLRGGVPFHAYFCDAAFAPYTAKWYCASDDTDNPDELDAPYNSLLAAVIDWLRDLVVSDDIAAALYKPLANALCDFRVGMEPREYAFEPATYWTKKEKKR